MIRIKGLIAFIVIAGLIFAGYYFSSNQMIENFVEGQASQANGALVEIENLSLNLFSMQASWDGIQVTDPGNTMKNTFQTGKAEFKVNPWAFVFGKNVVIENMQLSELRLNTDRETDGAIEIEEKEPEDTEPGFVAEIGSQVASEVKSNAEARFDNVSSKINADSLVATLDLVSINKMDSLKNSLQQDYAEWDSTLKNTDLKQDVSEIQTTAESLNPEKIKDVKSATKAIETVKTLKLQVDSVRNNISTLQKNFTTDIKEASASLGQVDNWIQSDYERAASLARLPKIDAQNIGQTLFGEALLSDFQTYLGYAGTARTYLNRLKSDKEPEVPRYEGVDYAFSDKYDYPGFWIKKIELSGFTNRDLRLSGLVTDISSDQQKTGLPAMIDLSGVNEKEEGVVVTAELNYLSDEPKELFEARYQNFSLVNQKLSPSSLLPYDIKTGTGSIVAGLQIIDRRIRSEISYQTQDLTFDFEEAGKPKDRLESLIRTAVSSSSEIDATAIVDGTADKLQVKVRSNIDDLFLTALRSTISKEVENARRKIQAEVDEKVNAKKAELERLVASKERELRAEYGRLEQQLNDQLAIVEQKRKELDEHKKKLEKDLKNKAVDAIKKKIDF